ncbi:MULTISPECIES: hypothetical protein [unclassified Acidovorax]|uniref:hypothetical protein n=1 Tax=unclassified Acidovorax TaxID=2684926 RepID=UPI000A6B0459|nr:MULTISPECIES: hypothetical protein [unclassified Acidovorax]
MTSCRSLRSSGVALVLAGLVAGAIAQAPYSLKTVEARPIPRDDILQLWREVALQQCADARKRFNLSNEECLREIARRADACTVSQAPSTPALVASTAVSKDIGRKYLQCAVPYYFCRGVEVKTEKEALAQCR